MKKNDWRLFFFKPACKYIFEEFPKPSDDTDEACRKLEIRWIEYGQPYTTQYLFPEMGEVHMVYRNETDRGDSDKYAEDDICLTMFQIDDKITYADEDRIDYEYAFIELPIAETEIGDIMSQARKTKPGKPGKNVDVRFQKKTISMDINGKTQFLPAISYTDDSELREPSRLYWVYGWGLILQDRLNERDGTYSPFRRLVKCKWNDKTYVFTNIKIVDRQIDGD